MLPVTSQILLARFGPRRMRTSDHGFSTLIQGVREGSNAAFEELVSNYSGHVYRVVRRKLASVMRSRADSTDFVQSVWAVFFENRHRVVDCQSPAELINFLAKVASDKVIDERRRRLTSAKANANREVPLEECSAADRLQSKEPTPSALAISDECLHRLLDCQQTSARQMLQMRLDGATYEDIAIAFGVSPKTVQRTFRRLFRRVEA